VIFTTLQKFSPEDSTTDYPALTDRRNMIVIADEAHRSQYDFRATLARDSVSKFNIFDTEAYLC
jgi:type I restriction enzyme, R subunit